MRCLVLGMLLVAGPAFAGGKPIPGMQAKPPKFVDESTAVMQLGYDGDGGYWVKGYFEVMNGVSKDRARIDVKRGGKLLTSTECSITTAKYNRDLAGVTCDGRGGKVLKGAGPIEVDLVYTDDADDKEYLLRTFKSNVKLWDNKKVVQLEADDLLGVAHVAIPSADGTGEAELRFWMAGTPGNGSILLRCNVDGKPIREIEGGLTVEDEFEADIIKGNARTFWNWQRVKFTSALWQGRTDSPNPDVVHLADHPGEWQCVMRRDGATLREFKFKVDKKGVVESHPMQTAKDAAPLAPRTALVEVKIGKDNGVDRRIKPDLLKKSRGWGMPWPQHDSVKAVLAALPPAYENTNPVAAKKKPGKIIDGLSATPPKIVDESGTLLELTRESGGYGFIVNARVVGVTQSKSNIYRVDWKAGGKVVATKQCSWQQNERGSDVANLDCTYRDKALTNKGPIEAQLILSDDSDGNEYLLRTFKVTVVAPKNFSDTKYVIVPDDVLATAWVRHGDGTMWFRFWVAFENPDPSLRCTVNGTKIPDISLSLQTSDPAIEYEIRPTQQAESKKYIWQKINGQADIAPGKLPSDATKSADRVGYLAHYPGKWACQVRHKGKQFRELEFTVSKDGYVEADPAQSGAPSPSNVVPIALKWGKDNLDLRIRPDAMKKSRGFGLPWPKAPTTKFPAASGLPDPK